MTKPVNSGENTLKQFNTASEAKEWLEANPEGYLWDVEDTLWNDGSLLEDYYAPFTPMVPLTNVATREQFESVINYCRRIELWGPNYEDYLKRTEAHKQSEETHG